MRRDLWHDLGTRRFWRHFALNGFSAVGFLAVILELVDVLFPSVVAPEGRRLAVGVAVLSVAYGIARAWPRPIEQSYNSPNTKIRLVKGDLFQQDVHLVIGMVDTFDTETPHVIARQSVQGQFQERVFGGDLRELDRQLDEALLGVAPVESVDKTGKRDRYPLGTVATLRNHATRYFCVAYTSMNEQNEARATTDGVWHSLSMLWKAVSADGNGEAVAIPVIGGGQARLSQVLPAQDSIRLIVLSFMLASRAEKVCDELIVVVRPEEYNGLDRLEIQAFLRSLRAS